MLKYSHEFSKKYLVIPGLILLIILTILFNLGNTSITKTISDNFLSSQTQIAAVGDVTDGLVAHYTFDDPNNLGKDDSGHGNDGTFQNGPTPVAGKVGSGALQFDGVDDVVDVANSSSIQNLTPLTMSAWIYPKSYGTRARGAILDKEGGSHGWVFFIYNKAQLAFSRYYNDNSSMSIYSTPGSISLNKWYHVTVTWDGDKYYSHAKLYINGVEDTSASGLDATTDSIRVDDSSKSLHIGRGAYNNWVFDGTIDDVRIYNRVLTADEVAQLYTYNGIGVNGGSVTTPPVIPEIDQTSKSDSNQNPSTNPDISTNPTPTPPLDTVVQTQQQSGTCSAHTYYIDFEGGNDANTGMCSGNAWKHAPGSSDSTGLARTTHLQPGDTVLFKRGVSYRGLVSIPYNGSAGSPITYAGDAWPGISWTKAIIDGSQKVTKWTRCQSASTCGNNPNWQSIYYADIIVPAFLNIQPALSLNVYQNGQPLSDAQYPNALNSLYPITRNFMQLPPSAVTPTSLTDSRLAQFGSGLVGKWIYIWVNPNETVPEKIISYNPSTNTIIFSSTQVYTDHNTLYAIVNSPDGAVFDTPGEYYLDETVQSGGTNRLYLWPLQNQNLVTGGEITIGMQSGGIYAQYPSNIIIKGFKIQYQTGDNYGEGNAITSGGSALSSDVIIKDNEIVGVRAAGSALIYINNVAGLTVQGNYIHDTGGGRGIQTTGSNIMIKDNNIRNIPGTAIYFPGAQNSSIIGNTIVDGGGSHANGISVYQGAHNVIVSNNIVKNFNIAFTLENSSGLDIYNNLFAGSVDTGYVVAGWGGLSGINRMFNNTIVGSNNGAATFFANPSSITLQNNILENNNNGILPIDVNKNLYVSSGGIDGSTVFVHAPRFQNYIYHLDEAGTVYVQGFKDITHVGDLIVFDGDYSQPRRVSKVTWGIYRGNHATGISFVPPLSSLSAGVISIWKDQNFTTDYNLQASSPAIGAGNNLYQYFTTDILGTPRPTSASWDIGAYQYCTSNCNTVPVITPPITPPIQPPTSLKGDFNHDGLVNSLDFSALSAYWNQQSSTYDLTGDNLVNTLDYIVLVKNWSK